MAKLLIWTLSSLLAAGACLSSAQIPKAPLISQTFKDSVEGWTGVGQTAKLGVSHDPDIAQPTAGALKFDYSIAKGDFNAIYLPAALGSLTNAKSFKFRVRADSTTMLAVTVQEQDGGRYSAMVHVPKDAWQTVELSTTDFILGQDKNDPKDPDGKLDMDRITGIVIGDMSQFLLEIDNPLLQELFGVKAGSHAMYLDSFSVGTEPIAADVSSHGNDVILETFAHPQLAWIGLGAKNLAKSSGTPMQGTALKADYHQTPGKPAILTRTLPSWILTGTKILTFDVAVAQPTKLIVQFEQYDGGKYNMLIDVPGGSTVQHQKLLLSGFTRGDDSTDSDTKIHLALVKSILFIDVSGMLDQADKDTTLWVNKLVASTSG